MSTSKSRNADLEAEARMRSKQDVSPNIAEEAAYLQMIAAKNGVDPSIPRPMAPPRAPAVPSKLTLKAGTAYKKLLIKAEPKGVFVEVEGTDLKFSGHVDEITFE